MARIKATQCKGRDLLPGDLFSTVGSTYWDGFGHLDSVGERVYIRTNVPSDNFPDADADIFRIEVIRDERQEI